MSRLIIANFAFSTREGNVDVWERIVEMKTVFLDLQWSCHGRQKVRIWVRITLLSPGSPWMTRSTSTRVIVSITDGSPASLSDFIIKLKVRPLDFRVLTRSKMIIGIIMLIFWKQIFFCLDSLTVFTSCSAVEIISNTGGNESTTTDQYKETVNR